MTGAASAVPPDAPHELTARFVDLFGGPPEILVRAPGRVNLIGEHTDYNEGFVLPMAIERAVWLAAQPRADGRVILQALDVAAQVDFSLDDFKRSGPGPAEYIKGVAWALQQAGYTLTGFEGLLTGDVPIGAGLSSSAALEMAAARTFSACSGFPWEPLKAARLAQQAENEWVGVRCGIMDQWTSAAGLAGHALLIDCRSLTHQTAPLPEGLSIVIMDTGVRRDLAASAYNDRRAACEEAARLLGVPALRDLDLDTFRTRRHALEPTLQRRARHVIAENDRTLQAHQALLAGNGEAVGELMRASHTSLREDYEVSSTELDTLVNLASRHPACLGARMTGAGFGGCAVALVGEDEAPDFIKSVAPAYSEQAGVKAALFTTSAADGVSLLLPT